MGCGGLHKTFCWKTVVKQIDGLFAPSTETNELHTVTAASIDFFPEHLFCTNTVQSQMLPLRRSLLICPKGYVAYRFGAQIDGVVCNVSPCIFLLKAQRQNHLQNHFLLERIEHQAVSDGRIRSRIFVRRKIRIFDFLGLKKITFVLTFEQL